MSVTSIHADEDTVVGRYLAGKLSESESEAFEARLTTEPALLRELEATARLRFGLETLRERGELDGMLKPTSPSWIRWAAAAALAVIVLAFSMFRSSPQATVHPLLVAALSSLATPQGQLPTVGAKVAVFRKRADAYDAVIDRPAAGGAIELRVLPETGAAVKQYDVSLARLDEAGAASEVSSVASLPPAEDGFVTAYIDAAQLSPGVYRLEVRGASAGASKQDAADVFRIRVRESGAPAPAL